MNYRRLGRAGLQVSELSFGSWVTFHNQADLGLAIEMLAAAYEALDGDVVYAGKPHLPIYELAERMVREALSALGGRKK